ncbi:MAG: hypothetical protein L3K06_02085 [Thermoplasmata archaeon]|nr:hypothetical protein [Thermoplasmata archaeon]
MSGAPDASPPTPTPRELLAAVVQRILHPRAVRLDTRRPVEVPVITETKRRWAKGDRPGAVQYAYESVLGDLERAFGVHFPADWTHEDILERGVTPEMGSIPDFLIELLKVYEPVRYGRVDPGPARSPEPILQSIYGHPQMWGLYLATVPAVDDTPITDAPLAPSPSLPPAVRARATTVSVPAPATPAPGERR